MYSLGMAEKIQFKAPFLPRLWCDRHSQSIRPSRHCASRNSITCGQLPLSNTHRLQSGVVARRLARCTRMTSGASRQ